MSSGPHPFGACGAACSRDLEEIAVTCTSCFSDASHSSLLRFLAAGLALKPMDGRQIPDYSCQAVGEERVSAQALKHYATPEPALQVARIPRPAWFLALIPFVTFSCVFQDPVGHVNGMIAFCVRVTFACSDV